MRMDQIRAELTHRNLAAYLDGISDEDMAFVCGIAASVYRGRGRHDVAEALELVQSRVSFPPVDQVREAALRIEAARLSVGQAPDHEIPPGSYVPPSDQGLTGVHPLPPADPDVWR